MQVTCAACGADIGSRRSRKRALYCGIACRALAKARRVKARQELADQSGRWIEARFMSAKRAAQVARNRRSVAEAASQ